MDSWDFLWRKEKTKGPRSKTYRKSTFSISTVEEGPKKCKKQVRGWRRKLGKSSVRIPSMEAVVCEPLFNLWELDIGHSRSICLHCEKREMLQIRVFPLVGASLPGYDHCMEVRKLLRMGESFWLTRGQMRQRNVSTICRLSTQQSLMIHKSSVSGEVGLQACPRGKTEWEVKR